MYTPQSSLPIRILREAHRDEDVAIPRQLTLPLGPEGVGRPVGEAAEELRGRREGRGQGQLL